VVVVPLGLLQKELPVGVPGGIPYCNKMTTHACIHAISNLSSRHETARHRVRTNVAQQRQALA
jgi:hypothetical protein